MSSFGGLRPFENGPPTPASADTACVVTPQQLRCFLHLPLAETRRLTTTTSTSLHAPLDISSSLFWICLSVPYPPGAPPCVAARELTEIDVALTTGSDTTLPPSLTVPRCRSSSSPLPAFLAVSPVGPTDVH